jgi:hypothetical protein
MARRHGVRAAVAAAVVAAGLTVSAAPAQAYSGGTVGERETVCAETLFVRTSPGGAWLGTLYRGQTFLVEKISSGWDYGFAYGYINHHGWVQDGWFC